MERVFQNAFAGPATFWDPEDGHRVLTEPVTLGTLELPTGQVAIHDPGYEFAPDVLDRSLAPGTHLVHLALRSWVAPDGTLSERAITAAARVSLGRDSAQGFVPVRSRDGTRELAFGVDSGLISVFDRSLVRRLAGAAILDTLPESIPGSALGRPPAEIVTTPLGSLFICQAGKGDGAYRAWWGLDGAGEATDLVVDFGELEYSRWRIVELTADTLLLSGSRMRLALAGSGLELEPVPFHTIGIPPPPTMNDDLIALRRPAGPRWEFSLLDEHGAWAGGPGQAQLVPGPWFELFQRNLVERAATVRVRIHEGTAPLEPIER